MAQFEIKLFPSSRSYTPTEAAAQKAKDYLYGVEGLAEDVDYYFYNSLTLVEGDGKAKLRCPSCTQLINTELDFGYYTENVVDVFGASEQQELAGAAVATIKSNKSETQELFRKLSEEKTSEVTIVMPCCGSQVPFINLNLGSAFGLALFKLRLGGEMHYPSFNEEHLQQLENILSCNLKGYGYVVG